MSNVRLAPFLKWAGGKRWFTRNYSHLFPHFAGRYIEPFLGSGAVYFHIRPTSALLGDCNRDLIETYAALKENWSSVAVHLRAHISSHSRSYYYAARSRIPEDRAERAARLIYLNRTCWNGLYRVNAQGEFNVPLGTCRALGMDDEYLSRVSDVLQTAELHSCDFQYLVEEAGPGDLLFVDPPYTVTHSSNGFIKYNETLFSWSDQERLAKCLVEAQHRGASLIATNAPHSSVRRLYEQDFCLIEVGRFSSISATSAARRNYTELLILSSDIPSEGAAPSPAR